jgi:hypothetical protein
MPAPITPTTTARPHMRDGVRAQLLRRGLCPCEGCVDATEKQFARGAKSARWGSVHRTVHGQEAPASGVRRAKGRVRKPRHSVRDRVAGGCIGVLGISPVISIFGIDTVAAGPLFASVAVVGAVGVPWVVTKVRASAKLEAPAVAPAPTAARPAVAPVKLPSRKDRLASTTKDHEAVVMAWAKYETDVSLQIDYPAMTDVRKPETSALAKALRAAEIASRHAGDDLDSVIRYEGAVLDLEAAFATAEAAARLDSEHPLTTDQKDLAHTLLAITVDPNGNVHERRQAHQRLLKLLDGVIILAEPARLALEVAAARGEIAK